MGKDVRAGVGWLVCGGGVERFCVIPSPFFSAPPVLPVPSRFVLSSALLPPSGPMVHVARGSEPRLLSFFDLRVVFGRSMVNLYSVAKNQSQSDNTNKAVDATILLAYMDQRPAQHL